jgi:hypothetical protein
MTELLSKARLVESGAGGLARAVLLAGFTLVSCVNDPSPLPAASWVDGGFAPARTPSIEGQPCATPGALADCSTQVALHPDYVVCSDGKRRCDGGVWGSCESSGSLRVQSLGLRLQTVGTAAQCGRHDCDGGTPGWDGGPAQCGWNYCDPDCWEIDDGPDALSPGDGTTVVVMDGGVTLGVEQGNGVGVFPCTGLNVTATPSNIVVTGLAPLAANSVLVTANLTPEGCYPAGAPPVLWSLDHYDVATVASDGTVTLKTPWAGLITVTGYTGNLSGSTAVSVTVDVTDVSQAPSGTTNYFQGTATTTDTANVLYPYANTVFPLGLPAPLVQWDPGTAGPAQAVEVTLRYPRTYAPLFRWSEIIPESSSLALGPSGVLLAPGPRAAIPQAAWSLFERLAAGFDASIVLTRLTGGGSGGSTLGNAIETPIHFATDRLRASIYYTSYGTSLVQNYTPYLYEGINSSLGGAVLALGQGDTQPTIAAGFQSWQREGCRACHRLSADGSTMLANSYTSYSSSKKQSVLYRLGIDPPSGGSSLGVADGTFSWGALYPDGSLVFTHTGPPSQYRWADKPGGLDGSYDCSGSPDCGSQLYPLPAPVLNQPLPAGIPRGLQAALPAFSPDGTKVVFNHYAGPAGAQGTGAGDKRSLALMDFDPIARQFSGLRKLVTEPPTACGQSEDPCTDLWPSFLPDGSAVVYEHEVFNNGVVASSERSDFGGSRSGCDHTNLTDACGNDGTRAELWWVDTQTTAPPTALATANGAGTPAIPTGPNGHTLQNETALNYQPRVGHRAAGGYQWVAFTSRRLYGNVATMNPWWSDPRYKPLAGENGASTKKIWVAALDPRAQPGTDPSHPAFFLPGQELLAANGRPAWVSEPCRSTSTTLSSANQCETDFDCCDAPASAVCSVDMPVSYPATRHCVPMDAAPCVPGDPAACSGAPTGSRCASGSCQVPPVPWVYSAGEFTRDFLAQCPQDKLAVWRELQCRADLPAGTGIVFSVSSATTEPGLDTAPGPFLALTAAPAGPLVWQASQPVDAILKANLVTPGLFLRVTVRLWPSPDGHSAPTLWDWRQLYDCVDAV